MQREEVRDRPHWIVSPDGKLLGVACGDEKLIRTGSFEEFCESATYFLLTKLPREVQADGKL